MDDFNYEDFEDSFNEDEYPDDFSAEEKMKANEIFKKVLDGYVRFNYEAIEVYGLDIDATKKMVSLDPRAMTKLKETLEFMMSHFIKTEEYEKCAVLRGYLEQI